MYDDPMGMMSVRYAPLSTQTPQEATERDALKFEKAMSQYAVSTGPGFPDLFTENETVSASIAEASGKGSEKAAQKEAQEARDQRDKELEIKTMGDAILRGMNEASTEWQQTYQGIAEIMDPKKHPFFTPRDLLHVQTLLLNSMVTVDLATRVVSKVSTSVDTLLRLQ